MDFLFENVIQGLSNPSIQVYVIRTIAIQYYKGTKQNKQHLQKHS